MHAQYLLALYRSGRQVDALAHYRRIRNRLGDELGVEPGTRLSNLHDAILSHDISLSNVTTSRSEDTAPSHDAGATAITPRALAVTPPGGVARLDWTPSAPPVRWETDFGAAELTHVNLYDGTVEGLTLLDVPASTVQYHPEAGPGPNDSLYLFDRFVDAAA